VKDRPARAAPSICAIAGVARRSRGAPALRCPLGEHSVGRRPGHTSSKPAEARRPNGGVGGGSHALAPFAIKREPRRRSRSSCRLRPAGCSRSNNRASAGPSEPPATYEAAIRYCDHFVQGRAAIALKHPDHLRDLRSLRAASSRRVMPCQPPPICLLPRGIMDDSQTDRFG